MGRQTPTATKNVLFSEIPAVLLDESVVMGGATLPAAHLFHTHAQRQKKPFKAWRAALGACLELNNALGCKVNKSDSLLLILARTTALGASRQPPSQSYQCVAPGKPRAGKIKSKFLKSKIF